MSKPAQSSASKASSEVDTLRQQVETLLEENAHLKLLVAKYRRMLYALHMLCRQLGWQVRGDHAHHRLHDLRHTFIVRSALHLYEQDGDVERGLPALSIYVGHAKVVDTYWYLTGIPELMAIAAERFHRYAQGGAI